MKMMKIIFVRDDSTTAVVCAPDGEFDIFLKTVRDMSNSSDVHGNSKSVLVVDFVSEEVAKHGVRPVERYHEFRTADMASRYLGFNYNKVAQCFSAERAAMEAKKENGRAEITLRGVTLCYADEFVI